MIPRSKIDEIMDVAHIEDVVSEYVSLKKRGSNLLGLCPFHNERRPPSMSLPVKGFTSVLAAARRGTR